MFVFGHLGIGLKITQPFWKPRQRDPDTRLPISMILLGAVLPDLIDKSLYLGPALIYGREAMAASLISGTRTFAHTALLTVMVAGLAAWRKSRALMALSVGMFSHLFLDGLSDVITLGADKVSFAWLLWPFAGWRFPVNPFQTFGEQAHRVTRPFYLSAELLGVTLLAWEYWSRHRSKAAQSKDG
jgi:membrane-bound metal-dependent hydrolase YbcI (DUF457 family)